MKKKLFGLFEKIHFRLFKHPVGTEMQKFFGNLSWSFLGGGMASFIMLILNILGGRLIGPAGYGKYSLILNISQILMLPLIFGMDTIGVRNVSLAKDEKSRATTISSSLYFLIANSCLFIILFFALYRFNASRFGLDSEVLFLILGMTLIMSMRNVLDGFIRGVGLFQYQFWGRILEVSVTTTAFLILFFGIRHISAFSYLMALLSGAFILCFYYVRRLLPYRAPFSWPVLKEQISYGKVILLGSILGTIFTSLDVIIIARYLNLTQVGIYNAYYTASTNLVAQLVQMFINVFFPSVSKAEDKKAVFTKINHLSLLAFLPMGFILSAVVWLIISLFGSKYGIHWNYVFGFGFLASLQIISTIYGSLITAISKSLYKRYLVGLNTLSAVHIGFYGLMIYLHLTSISLILLFMIINLLILITIEYQLIRRYYQAENGSATLSVN